MLAGKKNILLKFINFMLMLLVFAPFAYAEGGDRSDSPGIPGQKPLSFLSVSLMGGGKVQNAADLTTEPKFKLEFDKNVVNSTLWENNRKCFSLVSQNNENIPLSVTKVDDTIDFSQRNNIFVQPVNPLSPGTTYYLKVSPELKAKNGVSTLAGTTSGQGVTIAFKTGQAEQQPSPEPGQANGQGAAQPQENANGAVAASEPGRDGSTGGQPPRSPTEAPGQQAAAGAGGESAGDDAPAGQQTELERPAESVFNLNYTSLLTVLALALVAGWIVVEVFIKKKKRG